MATKLQDKADPAELHDQDFYAWVLEQARQLRAIQESRPNLPLDFEHLIEEVEDLARSDLRTARSQLRRLVEHLLKLEHSPATAPRRKWAVSIIEAQAQIDGRLTTSMRGDVEPQVERLYSKARRLAAGELIDHDEPEAVVSLLETCHYTLDQLLDETWRPTSRHGHVDEPF